jgi:hypothetical protein
MTRYIIISLMLNGFLSPALAQDLIKAEGFARILVEDHMSKEDAREKAREQAIINAIESAFGAYVEKDADVDIEDGEVRFRIIGHTLVRGDWLKTISEKFEEENRKIRGRKNRGEEVWISCKITGKIRRIDRPETALEFTPLNCPDPVCRTYDFMDGEPFYLSFRTPVDGYLSIFMTDESRRVYRLLPYQKMPEEYLNAVPVTADDSYLFFLNEEDYDYFSGFSYMMTDEIVMSTREKEEFLDLFVIFSTTDFKKPLLTREEEVERNFVVPKSLGLEKFEEWIADNRINDPAFLYKRVTLTIKK